MFDLWCFLRVPVAFDSNRIRVRMISRVSFSCMCCFVWKSVHWLLEVYGCYFVSSVSSPARCSKLDLLICHCHSNTRVYLRIAEWFHAHNWFVSSRSLNRACTCSWRVLGECTCCCTVRACVCMLLCSAGCVYLLHRTAILVVLASGEFWLGVLAVCLHQIVSTCSLSQARRLSEPVLAPEGCWVCCWTVRAWVYMLLVVVGCCACPVECHLGWCLLSG